MVSLNKFRFWAHYVIPLVYDDSLSYYEVLCKVVEYINHLIENEEILASEIDELKKDLAEVQKFIDNFDEKYIRKLVSEMMVGMVFFGLTMNGYFVAYVPDSWNDITFNTTGYDYETDEYNFGHLVLSY